MKTCCGKRTHWKSRRQGAVLIFALVALLIVMALLGTMLLTVVQTRRQLRVERDARQCELLLRAGIDRAAFRARREADYRGETWAVPAEALHSGEGRVTIAFSEHPDSAARQLEIVADYPFGSELSVRRSFRGLLTSRTTTPEEN